MCLLKAVFVQAENNYSWGGPGTNTDSDPTTEKGEKFEIANKVPYKIYAYFTFWSTYTLLVCIILYNFKLLLQCNTQK